MSKTKEFSSYIDGLLGELSVETHDKLRSLWKEVNSDFDRDLSNKQDEIFLIKRRLFNIENELKEKNILLDKYMTSFNKRDNSRANQDFKKLINRRK